MSYVLESAVALSYGIDWDVSDTNTKVYGDGSAIFFIFFLRLKMVYQLNGSHDDKISTANPLRFNSSRSITL